MAEKKAPREMTGAELNSMLKSSINFKSFGIKGAKRKTYTIYQYI